MKVLYGVTGSIATSVTVKIVRALEDAGHKVQIVATERARYFLNLSDAPGILYPDVKIWTDADEWNYEYGGTVQHIALREWADMILIAPLSANTLAKLANGLADNLLTSVMRAWHLERPVIVAPAMNTFMWEHPATAIHLKTLEGWYEHFSVVQPTVKKLACGDTGIGALAEIPNIVIAVERSTVK